MLKKWLEESGWSEATYTATPGTHTYTWKYEKDRSGVGGEDAAYIDDVNVSKNTKPYDNMKNIARFNRFFNGENVEMEEVA
jgi:hypothetical protein